MGGVAEGVTVDVRCADTGEYDGGGAAHGAEEGCVDWTKLCDGGHCGGSLGGCRESGGVLYVCWRRCIRGGPMTRTAGLRRLRRVAARPICVNSPSP